MPDLLRIDDLCVRFSDPGGGVVHALNGVTLRLDQGDFLGLLGESGSGKSTLVKVLLRMLPKNADVPSGKLEFEGRDLLQLNEREMKAIRGARIAMIPQEPGLALNPVIKIGDQIAEVLHAHKDWNRRRCRNESESLLERVNLRKPDRRMYDAYPHQLSGGEQQRAVIAQALACDPALIVADEPTASLDGSTEAEILGLLRDHNATRKAALLLITHDPSILPGLAHRVAIMYAGRVVEEGSCVKIFNEPLHPYTKALLACMPPAVTENSRRSRFHVIEGSAPDAKNLPTGCGFSPRCGDRLHNCDCEQPSAQNFEDGSRVECFLYDA
jgi:oligopeptide/dipeptide ABC transporter ATP-binding protein